MNNIHKVLFLMEQRDRELNEKALFPVAAAAGVLGGIAFGQLSTPSTKAPVVAPVVAPVAEPVAEPVVAPKQCFGPHCRALLDTISDTEGTSGYDNFGYNTHFGGSQFEDLSTHPRKYVKVTNKKTGRTRGSSAAGRYQFMPVTYDDIKMTSMQPEEQDRGAMKLIMRRLKVKTPEEVEAILEKEGMSSDISDRLSGEWASLPNKKGESAYPNQHVQQIDKVKGFWDKNILKHKPAVVPVTTPPVVQESYKDRARRYLREAISGDGGKKINITTNSENLVITSGHRIPQMSSTKYNQEPKIEGYRDIQVHQITNEKYPPGSGKSTTYKIYATNLKNPGDRSFGSKDPRGESTTLIHTAYIHDDGSLKHYPMGNDRLFGQEINDLGSFQRTYIKNQNEFSSDVNITHDELRDEHHERLIGEHNDAIFNQ